LFHAEPESKTALKVLQIGDSGLMNQMMPIYFPPIKYMKKIYISPVFCRIDEEYIKRMMENNINTQEDIFLSVTK
jgi:hypothetical protein